MCSLLGNNKFADSIKIQQAISGIMNLYTKDKQPYQYHPGENEECVCVCVYVYVAGYHLVSGIVRM